MWLWQRKNGLPKELRIWIILCAISGMLHLIFLLAFVFGYKDQIIEARITLCKGAKRIVFVDDATLCKKNDVSQSTAIQEIISQAPTKAIMKSDAQVKNKTVSASDKKLAIQESEKNSPCEEKKLEGVSLSEESIFIEPSVQEVAEDIATEQVDEDKKIEKKEEEKSENKPIEQPVHNPNIVSAVEKSIEFPVQQLDGTTALPDVDLAKPEGLTEADIVVLKTDDAQYIEQMYAHAVQRIMENWKAPYGVPTDISCTIKASVHMRGHINELDITESSGSYLFDMAARTALLTTAMPDSMRGKSIIITFKQ